jgi:hypothetical protein
MKWQEPQIMMTAVNHDENSSFYVEFTLNFFINNFKLEDGRRIQRVTSQINQEIINQLKINTLKLS